MWWKNLREIFSLRLARREGQRSQRHYEIITTDVRNFSDNWNTQKLTGRLQIGSAAHPSLPDQVTSCAEALERAAREAGGGIPATKSLGAGGDIKDPGLIASSQLRRLPSQPIPSSTAISPVGRYGRQHCRTGWHNDGTLCIGIFRQPTSIWSQLKRREVMYYWYANSNTHQWQLDWVLYRFISIIIIIIIHSFIHSFIHYAYSSIPHTTDIHTQSI